MARGVNCLKFYAHAFVVFISVFIVLPLMNMTWDVVVFERFIPDMKHILVWTPIHGIHGDGQNDFIKEKCDHINCYLTSDRGLFADTGVFDAILFNLQDVSKGVALPDSRSYNQKYVFAANDTPVKYPICDEKYDDVFNWTWTYRSESTLHFHFITNYDSANRNLGVNVDYIKNMFNMDPIDKDMRKKLRQKHKAVAWFNHDCDQNSVSVNFAHNLKTVLGTYNLSLDEYGSCGKLTCRRKTMKPCFWRLQKEYFFYLVTEPSYADEYVTREVLLAFDNNAVPIVFGGASYNQFLPPHSYMEALKFGEDEIARAVHDAITNKTVYYDYFRWKKYYSVKQSPVFDVCTLCEKLNDPLYLTYRLINKRFRLWWNGEQQKLCSSYFSKLGF